MRDEEAIKQFKMELVLRDTAAKPVDLPMQGFTADMASMLGCPNCKEGVTLNQFSRKPIPPKFCQFCGQRFDWQGVTL